MNNSFLKKLLEILMRKLKERRWRQVITCLAAVAVFTTTYAMILPAISMTDEHPKLEAEQTLAWTGEELTVRVTAVSPAGEAGRTVVLTAVGEGADLSDQYVFDEEGVCIIEDEAGREIKLHRSVREDKTDTLDYWFVLDANEETSFTLKLKDQVDPERFTETAKALKEAAETASASNAAEARSAEGGQKEKTASPSDAGTERPVEGTSETTDTADIAEKTKDRTGYATPSDTVPVMYATVSDAEIAEANALAENGEEKILTEKDEESGFVEILDGAVINDLGLDGDDDEEEAVIIAELTVSAGSGVDFDAAVRDAEKNAEKRGDAELLFRWKDIAAKQAKAPKLLSSVDGAVIAVFYDEKAGIPESAELAVRKIEEDTEEYAEYLRRTQEALAEEEGDNRTTEEEDAGEDNVLHNVARAEFFRIAILDGNGNEIDPETEVKVVIVRDQKTDEAEEADKASDSYVVRFAEEGTELYDSGESENGGAAGVAFITGMEPVYGVIESETLTTRILTATGGNYEITMTCGPKAGVPKDAELKAAEIASGTEKYNSCRKTAEDLLTDVPAICGIHLFEMQILSGEEVIIPESSVQVSISYESYGPDNAVPYMLKESGDTLCIAEDTVFSGNLDGSREAVAAIDKPGIVMLAETADMQSDYVKDGVFYTRGAEQEDGSLVYRASMGHIIVKVTAPGQALPYGTWMKSSECTLPEDMLEGIRTFANNNPSETGALWAALEQDRMLVLDEISSADICFIDSNGEKVQPSSNVTVCLSANNLEGRNTSVVHINEDSSFLFLKEAEVKGNDATFSTASFSRYSLLGRELTEIEKGESIDGTNWMDLWDSDFFEYWDDILEQQLAEERAGEALYRGGALRKSSNMNAFLGAAADQNKEDQVVDAGGSSTNTADKVTVSKTIEQSSLENVFDITLQVKTETNIEKEYVDPDVAVVIVMDLSNSMRENFNGDDNVTFGIPNYPNPTGTGSSTKVFASVLAEETFIDSFYDKIDKTAGRSKVGLVGFNTDGNVIQGMTTFTAESQKTNFKKAVRDDLRTRMSDANYGNNAANDKKGKRFTNIEAGLLAAETMLNGCTNQNKFIILISDGLPTTYCKTGTTGYNPYTEYSFLKDKVKGANLTVQEYGTNYSDTGAKKAREAATRLKNNGVTIYTIGAGLDTFLTSHTHENHKKYTTYRETAVRGSLFALNQVERDFRSAYNGGGGSARTVENQLATVSKGTNETWANFVKRLAGLNWEIGNLYSETAFEDWLKNKIGSGTLIEVKSLDQIETAFSDVLEQLSIKSRENASQAWVVSDPMGTNLEFTGFYDKTGTNLQLDESGNSKNIKGYTENQDGVITSRFENTADYASSEKKFNWQLQKSVCTTSTSGGKTIYTYTLKYRVRLTNEVTSGFADGTSYSTNGTTTLAYQTVNNGVISNMKYINFPVPAVRGYLSELTFFKKDQFGEIVPNAVFKLEHDPGCSICKGNGHSVGNDGYLEPKTEAKSGTNGIVTFTNIPSGHTYKLTETTVPSGYLNSGSTYSVTVAYDAVTVTETKSNGTTVTSNTVTGITLENPLRTYKLRIKKKDGTTQQEKALEGAKFQLFTDAALTTLAKHPKRPGDPEESTVIGVTETINGTTYQGVLTSNSEGIIEIGELNCNKNSGSDPTYYYLKEIQPPAGYKLLADPIKIHLDPDSNSVTFMQTDQNAGSFVPAEVITTAADGTIYLITVRNTAGYELPSTGGPGTAAYTLAGTLTLMGSAFLYGFGRRRRY